LENTIEILIIIIIIIYYYAKNAANCKKDNTSNTIIKLENKNEKQQVAGEV